MVAFTEKGAAALLLLEVHVVDSSRVGIVYILFAAQWFNKQSNTLPVHHFRFVSFP